MARNIPYFELLDDPLVQQVIKGVPDAYGNGRGCLSLSATCRRMCTLVSGIGSQGCTGALSVAGEQLPIGSEGQGCHHTRTLPPVCAAEDSTCWQPQSL
jgi:hypothetical protein